MRIRVEECGFWNETHTRDEELEIAARLIELAHDMCPHPEKECGKCLQAMAYNYLCPTRNDAELKICMALIAAVAARLANNENRKFDKMDPEDLVKNDAFIRSQTSDWMIKVLNEGYSKEYFPCARKHVEEFYR